MPKTEEAPVVLTLNGKRLAREDNVICYGDPNDKHVVMITILEDEEINGVKFGKKVLIQLMLTDTYLSLRDRIVKQAEKTNFYDALDLGMVWLERVNLKK